MRPARDRAAGPLEEVPAARFQDAAPKLVQDEDGGDAWLLGGHVESLGLVAAMNQTPKTLKWTGVRYADMHPGIIDPKGRLELMDEDGISAAVFFPPQRTMIYFMFASRTLRSLITRQLVTCAPQTPLGEVLRTMQGRKIGSMLMVNKDGQPVGIFTRHDVLDRVALARRDLAQPISEVMTPHPLTLPAEASAYEAALLIADRGIRHIPVSDGNRLLGVVTERDLFALQRVSVRAINRTIAGAQSVEELRKASADIRRLARSLLGQGVSAEQMTQIISTLNDALVRQILDIEASHFDLQGLRWSWLAFGSEGRFEQTISTDQDNGLIFDSDGVAPYAIRAQLLPFAQEVNRALDSCGFPLCRGNIMAGNPQWCLSLEEWRDRFDHWMANTDPQALLNAVIFFDFRHLHGDKSLPQKLHTHLSGSGATAKIEELLSKDLIDTDAEDFTYKYSSADVPSRSRHPLYRQMYQPNVGNVDGYLSNYYMLICYKQKGVEDPRWRYYFFRQVGSIAVALADEPESIPCIISPRPSHYAPDQAWCAFAPGFFGRDHGNSDGIPPDGRALTCFGVYPAGGRADVNPDNPNYQVLAQQGQGANGAGIEPSGCPVSPIF